MLGEREREQYIHNAGFEVPFARVSSLHAMLDARAENTSVRIAACMITWNAAVQVA